RVVVAVSGGPDSLALLSILREILPALPLHLTVAHFDHGWRADSQDDRDFVASMAATWGFDFHTARAPTGTPHTENAARTARYAFLRQTATETNSTAIAPAARELLARTADILSEEDRFLDAQVAGLPEDIARDRDAFAKLPPALQRRAIRRLIPDAGFREIEADRAARSDSLPRFAGEGRGGGIVTAVTCRCDPATFKARDQVAHLDADLVRLPLTVATRKPGDRMRALGLKEPKRLQDILVDAHVPRQVRDSLPVVSDSEEIVWIPGVTVTESKRVTSATRRQLHLEIVRP